MEGLGTCGVDEEGTGKGEEWLEGGFEISAEVMGIRDGRTMRVAIASERVQR